MGISVLLLAADLSGYAEPWKLNWKVARADTGSEGSSRFPLFFCLPKSFKIAELNHYFPNVELF